MVIRRPGASGLEVRSMLFDDLLTGPAPIRFEGEVYKPADWHLEGEALSRRFVYRLERIEASPGAEYREYTRPRSPERQRAVEELTRQRDRAHVLAPLWGLYPGDEQQRLEVKYQYPSTKWTAITAYFLLACAAFQGVASLYLHLGLLMFVGPIYILVESFYRIYQVKVHGRPSASLGGYLFGLFLQPPR